MQHRYVNEFNKHTLPWYEELGYHATATVIGMYLLSGVLPTGNSLTELDGQTPSHIATSHAARRDMAQVSNSAAQGAECRTLPALIPDGLTADGKGYVYKIGADCATPMFSVGPNLSQLIGEVGPNQRIALRCGAGAGAVAVSDHAVVTITSGEGGAEPGTTGQVYVDPDTFLPDAGQSGCVN